MIRFVLSEEVDFDFISDQTCLTAVSITSILRSCLYIDIDLVLMLSIKRALHPLMFF